MGKITARENERSVIAFGMSLALHFLVLIVIMLTPGANISPTRPVSIPIHVEFEPPPRIVEIPKPVIPEPVKPKEVPEVLKPVEKPPVQNTVPKPQRTSSSAAASPAPAPAVVNVPVVPAWTPEPAPVYQNTFSSDASRTVQGGRLLDPAVTADTRSQTGTTSRDYGAEKADESVAVRSGSAASDQAVSDQELAAVDKAIAAGSSQGTGSGGTSTGGVSETVNVGDISNIVTKLSYRGASYSGPPALTRDVVDELQRRGITKLPVEISFVITPSGIISDLQTSVASIYPSLDAFLRNNLPRVLSFEPLPRASQNVWQKVELELIVKSN